MAELTTPMSAHIELTHADSLVERLRSRDEKAFEEVFDLYKDMVYSVATRMLADKAEAMDVTQEVFLTLHRKIHQFRGECTLKTWLYRVALNQAANRNRWWKRRRQDRMVSLGLDENHSERTVSLDPDCKRPLPDRMAYSSEVQGALQTALGKLPFDQRAAVVLRDVQGLPYEEIAELLHCQLGTVKSRIARGRDRLRELLQPYCGSQL